MAKLGQYRNNSNNTENPTSVYLDNIKGQLGKWNKEKGENDFHTLNNFIVLTVGFTIKGSVWNDSIKKYTNTYFSNEIRQFNETIYAIDMVFNNGEATKTLVAKGNWKTDVKPHMPQSIGIKAMITVLDLNDNTVKAFPVGASQYFGNEGLAKKIESYEPTDRLSYKITKMYTDGTKDSEGNDILISEEKLDAMKGSEAAKYKNRYISTIEKVGEATQEEIEAAEDMMDAVEEYYQTKRKFYEETYGEGEKAKEYATPQGVDSIEEIKEEDVPVMEAKGKTQEHNSSADIDASDLPF